MPLLDRPALAPQGGALQIPRNFIKDRTVNNIHAILPRNPLLPVVFSFAPYLLLPPNARCTVTERLKPGII
jgi:hypothetical protein